MADPTLNDLTSTATASLVLGALGRLMAMAVDPEQRKFGTNLLWEIPVAIGMGFIGLSIGEWLNLPWRVSYGIGITVSYVGPRTMLTVAQSWIGKKT